VQLRGATASPHRRSQRVPRELPRRGRNFSAPLAACSEAAHPTRLPSVSWCVVRKPDASMGPQGNEENVYTNEGLGARKVSTLLEFCRTHQVRPWARCYPWPHCVLGALLRAY
jgi:hypothetical protein